MAADTDPKTVGLELHDPLTVLYCLTSSQPGWKFVEEDIRVETSGQWTRGCCIVDRRGKRMKEGQGAVETIVPGDEGLWLDKRVGNRVERCVGSPDAEGFARVWLERVFGSVA
jgi:inosine-uridine nucleoside N-ribohydrolase